MINEKTSMSDGSRNGKAEPAAGGNLPKPGSTLWLGGGSRAVRGWIEASSTMLQSGAGMAEQMTRFSQTRLKADLDLWKTLSGCGSMSELVDCQTKYVQRMTSDYLGGLKELADSVLSTVNRTTDPPRE